MRAAAAVAAAAAAAREHSGGGASGAGARPKGWGACLQGSYDPLRHSWVAQPDAAAYSERQKTSDRVHGFIGIRCSSGARAPPLRRRPLAAAPPAWWCEQHARAVQGACSMLTTVRAPHPAPQAAARPTPRRARTRPATPSRARACRRRRRR